MRYDYFNIKVKSVIDVAIENGLSVATLCWPVCAKAPTKYNIAESVARDGENRHW